MSRIVSPTVLYGCHAIYLSVLISPRCEDIRSSAAPAKKTTDLLSLFSYSDDDDDESIICSCSNKQQAHHKEEVPLSTLYTDSEYAIVCSVHQLRHTRLCSAYVQLPI